jgi:hypothetical protein
MLVIYAYILECNNNHRHLQYKPLMFDMAVGAFVYENPLKMCIRRTISHLGIFLRPLIMREWELPAVDFALSAGFSFSKI